MSNDTGLGLAQVKSEGRSIPFSPGELTPSKESQKTRWIEMCYDPKEDVSHLESYIKTISQVIDSGIISSNKGSLTKDDVYLIIKSIANKYDDNHG